jgi:type III restriction enzyme
MDDELSKLETTEQDVEPELDFPALVRLLLDAIPNPWQGARILNESLAELRKRKIPEERIFASRLFLIKAIRDDLKAQVNAATEKEFRGMLAANELSFRLESSNDPKLNWELAETFELDITGEDKKIFRESGETLSRSLFEPVYQKQVNGLEKQAAWHLDGDKAVRWWHRIAVNQDWHLQGWQRSRVYPDFLACLHDTGDGKVNFTVLETKGLHLKGNEDTAYKEELFQLLTAHSQSAVSVGELKLGLKQQEMRFELILENNWREKIEVM